jgi:hypothetical protein
MKPLLALLFSAWLLAFTAAASMNIYAQANGYWSDAYMWNTASDGSGDNVAGGPVAGYTANMNGYLVYLDQATVVCDSIATSASGGSLQIALNATLTADIEGHNSGCVAILYGYTLTYRGRITAISDGYYNYSLGVDIQGTLVAQRGSSVTAQRDGNLPEWAGSAIGICVEGSGTLTGVIHVLPGTGNGMPVGNAGKMLLQKGSQLDATSLSIDQYYSPYVNLIFKNETNYVLKTIPLWEMGPGSWGGLKFDGGILGVGKLSAILGTGLQ